jgi:hypothetical protein
MEAIRKIEQRHPERDYVLTMLDEQSDTKSALETLAEIFPVDPTRGVDLTILPRVDTVKC